MEENVRIMLANAIHMNEFATNHGLALPPELNHSLNQFAVRLGISNKTGPLSTEIPDASLTAADIATIEESLTILHQITRGLFS